MAFSASADSSRAQLRYVVETVPGTTPASPAMKNLRFTGESLNGTRQTQSSQEIRSDRNTPDLVTTGETAGGDINIELSYGEYDDFVEAVLQGAWASDVVKNGVQRRSFTVEKEFGDVAKFEQFRGVELTGMSLNMSQGGFVTGAFNTMARSVTSAGAPLDVDPTPSLTNPVYNLTNHMTGLTINGSAYTDGIQSLDLSINNNAREQRQIGSKDLAGVGMGTFTLTGNMTAYFGSATAIMNAFDNDTPVALSWNLTAGGNTYTFLLPKVKFSSRTVVAGAINQDVVLALGWQAIYDETEGCTIKITRS